MGLHQEGILDRCRPAPDDRRGGIGHGEDEGHLDVLGHNAGGTVSLRIHHRLGNCCHFPAVLLLRDTSSELYTTRRLYLNSQLCSWDVVCIHGWCCDSGGGHLDGSRGRRTHALHLLGCQEGSRLPVSGAVLVHLSSRTDRLRIHPNLLPDGKDRHDDLQCSRRHPIQRAHHLRHRQSDQEIHIRPVHMGFRRALPRHPQLLHLPSQDAEGRLGLKSTRGKSPMCVIVYELCACSRNLVCNLVKCFYDSNTRSSWCIY